MFFTKTKPFYQKKWFIAGFLLLFFLVLFRILLPTIIVAIANKQLEEESPNFSLHIDDLDLKIIRGEYVVKGITGILKPSGENFLKIEDVIAKVPWKGILKGLILADVTVDKLDLIASQKMLNKAKKEHVRIKQELAKEEKEKDEEKKEAESRVRVNTFALNDSSVTIQNMLSFKGKEKIKISDINAHVRNLTPTKNDPITNFNLSASVFGPAPFRAVGQAKFKERPLEWDMNTEMRNFDLTTMNPFVREKVRAFIHKGEMDFYAEVESKDGKIDGYVKPFVKRLKMDTPENGFDFKGEAAKTGGNLVKVLLTDSEVKTLATKVPFEYKEKISVEVLPALTKAVEHKAKQNIQPGIEDNVGQKGMGLNQGLKQAQEEE